MGKEVIPWSGGGMFVLNKRVEPESSTAFRPQTDLRSLMRIEDACTEPLEESERIDVGSGQGNSTGTTLVAWLNAIQRKMCATGTDSVAYVIKPKLKTGALPPLNDPNLEGVAEEVCLFNDWGQVTLDQVSAFVVAVKANGCTIDHANSKYARTFLRGSIGPNLKQRADTELDLDASGTEYLHFIIMKLQATSATSGRKLISTLVSVKLSTFKGFHVVECATKLQEICQKLVGLGSIYVPSDMALLVLRCFDTTGIAQFDLAVTQMENELDNNVSAYTWNTVLRTLTTKFDNLLLTDRWPPLNDLKKEPASGYVVQLEHLQKSVRDIHSKIGKFDPDGANKKRGDHSKLTCHECGAKGHIRPNCPKLKKKGTETDAKGKKAKSGDETEVHPSKIPPKAGEPHSKTIQVSGRELVVKFCEKCAVWRSGKKAHLTSEHVDADKKKIEANTLQIHGQLGYGPFASLFPVTTNDPTMDFMTDLYDRNTPINDLKFDDEFSIETSPEKEENWTTVPHGKGTPINHAMVHPKESAGRV